MLVLKDMRYVVFVPKNRLLLDCYRLFIYDVIEEEKEQVRTGQNKNTMVHEQMTALSS